MKTKIKVLFLILIITITSSLYSCIVLDGNSSININVLNEEKVFVVGERVNLNTYIDGPFVTFVSSNEDIMTIQSNVGYCNKTGNVVIRAYNRINGNLIDELFIRVVPDEITSIEVDASEFMSEGESQVLVTSITPQSSTKKIKYYSFDEKIATVSNSGEVSAIKSGVVTIKAYSEDDESIYDEVTIFVKKSNLEIETVSEQIINGDKEVIEIDDSKEVLKGVIDLAKQSIIGINTYVKSARTGNLTLSSSASGVIYKRTYIDLSGYEVDKVDGDFTSYRYYVVTNKHIVKDKKSVTVVFNSTEYDATVLASDTKVDISVISFDCNYYIPTISFGNSDEVQTGEFVLSIGKTYKGINETTATFGVISYNARYVGTDTDGDEVNDWDALYIQHDSSISSYSTGGALINLKGEVVGINSIMLTDSKIDNMAFAIPSNLVMSLASQLELGKVPKRPLLGVTVITVKDIINQELQSTYKIPSEYNYGIYVNEVSYGGVAQIAGVKTGDVILEFNGIKLFYSYELRAALGEIIIGSGEMVNLKVWRNGEIIELEAVF